MADGTKNFAYIVNKDTYREITDIKPVSRQFIEKCKITANKYPVRNCYKHNNSS